MFDRSACAGTCIATDAHADLAALTIASLPPMRAQADASLLGREASYPALQLQPRLDGQWRAALHCLWRSAGR